MFLDKMVYCNNLVIIVEKTTTNINQGVSLKNRFLAVKNFKAAYVIAFSYSKMGSIDLDALDLGDLPGHGGENSLP